MQRKKERSDHPSTSESVITEIEALQAERRVIAEQRRVLGASVEAEAKARAGRAGVIVPPVVGLLLVALFGGLAATCSGSGSGAETFYGRVTVASSDAPVAEGDRCAVFFLPERQTNKPWDGRFLVECGEHTLYRLPANTGLDCSMIADHPLRCPDPDSADSGASERKLIFNRRSQTVEIHDEEERVVISLTVPPLDPERP